MLQPVEDDVQERSDHAWGALLLYELPSVILGVRPSKPGYEDMEELKPVLGYLTWAKGEVITPKGTIQWSGIKMEGSSHF